MKGFIVVSHADFTESIVVNIAHIQRVEVAGEQCANAIIYFAADKKDLLPVNESLPEVLKLIEAAQ